jgi:hypothetical protein
VRRVCLVLVDERGRGVRGFTNVVRTFVRRGARIVPGHAVGARLIAGAAQDHETLIRRRRIGGIVGGAREAIVSHDQRIVGPQRHEDRAAALRHQIESVVEELAENSECRVVRCRQSHVGCHIGNEKGSRRVRRRGAAGGGDGGRIRHRLVDDQVAGQARLAVADNALLLRVRGGRARCRSGAVRIEGLGGEERRRDHAREHAVRRAEQLLPGDQIVKAAVDGAEAEWMDGIIDLVRPRAQ